MHSTLYTTLALLIIRILRSESTCDMVSETHNVASETRDMASETQNHLEDTDDLHAMNLCGYPFISSVL